MSPFLQCYYVTPLTIRRSISGEKENESQRSRAIKHYATSRQENFYIATGK